LKTVLAAINAKYIHSCLALYSLRASCPQYRDSIIIREFTVNQERGFILRGLYACKPDIIGFSCYIWNIGIVMALAADLKKLLPGLIVILGGPEVSYDPVCCPADFIVRGEGERAFQELMAYYNDGIGDITKITGGAADIGRLSFPYADGAGDFTNRIIYYESSRGCPFHCQYCLSGGQDSQVRVLPLPRVYDELRFFLNARVRQVKFVDRTFNCIKERAINIWEFLKENDNGITNFHFEISGGLLDEESLRLLSGARVGLFQFEIGVQSTNEDVLRGIDRHADLQRLKKNIAMLRESGNIHLHLDLIAGLPGEGYSSFGRSFNEVYGILTSIKICQYITRTTPYGCVCSENDNVVRYMKPDALQLGFLKLLKGTKLRENAGRYGIVYEDSPPYEVLRTNGLSFDEICRLKDIESVFDGLYNTGLAPLTLQYLARGGAFEFFGRLAEFWRDKGYSSSPLGKMGMYAALYEYCRSAAGVDVNLALELMRFDLLSRENEKSPPEWLVPKPSPEGRSLYRAYKASMGADSFTIQTFEYDIVNRIAAIPEKRRNTVLFRYKNGKGGGIFHEIGRGNQRVDGAFGRAVPDGR